ncbi:uncharacterized protein LOC129217450 isoform X1 [Uloborus diversus]|uniref:uncharacterized protein LOC129217450 isoform X1 n=1 Tax=Uloborus diversus TaxID=327109 RepID=UPI0024093F5C|nr:uncharacterized protein LOC129217450 isoform X1 [Uloborus diversus]
MGKFKNKNWRLHTTAPKRQVLENATPSKLKSCTIKPGSIKSASKLFENIKIPVEALEFQASYHNLSESSSASLTEAVKSKVPSKKCVKMGTQYSTRMSARKMRIMEMMKRDEKFQKQRVYGTFADFDSLNDALPTLQELTDLTKHHKTRREQYESGRPNSFRRLDQEMVNAVETFQAVFKDENYKSDPFNAISLHVKQRIEAERKEN